VPSLPADDAPAGGVSTKTAASPGPIPPADLVEMPVPTEVNQETGMTFVLVIPGMLEQETPPMGGGGAPAPACVTDAEAVLFTV